MADILSLNKARKARAKAGDARRAGENRVAHGRTKAQKAFTRAEEARRLDRLESHRRTSRDDASGG